METEHTSSMISRREILKRGAFVGGAVLWVTPVVQAVGMGRAYAKDVSPNCSRYCIKWDVDTNEPATGGPLTCTLGGTISAYPIWGNTWAALGKSTGGANALTCPGDVDPPTSDDEAVLITTGRGKDRKFVVYGDQTAGFWVAFPSDIKLAYLADVNLYSVGAKCGQTLARFTPTVEDDPCYTDPGGVAFKRIHIPAYCGSGKNKISHIELIIDWCPNS